MSKKNDTLEDETKKAAADQDAETERAKNATEESQEQAKEDKAAKQKELGIERLKPEENSGVLAWDVESHKVTEIFQSSDVVFTREGGAGELRAQPKHEAATRFVEIDGKVESVFKDNQTTVSFKLKDGRKVHQTGHKVITVDKDGNIDDAGPRLNIHNVDQQG